MLYILLLLYFRNPPIFAALLFAVFVIYVVWDFYKTKEHTGSYYPGGPPTFFQYVSRCLTGWLFADRESKLIGEIVTVGWTIFFAILIPFAFLPAVGTDWGKLCLALVVISAVTRYRLDKKHSAKWIWSVPFKILMGASVAYIVLYDTRVLCF
jgi:hypothetical protein